MGREFKVGDRVGAILGSKGDDVQFLGYGTYEGREVPPKTGKNSLTCILNEAGMENPKIKLDNGDIVWGCECWWGTEDAAKEILEGRNIKDVRISDFRGESA